MLVRTVLGRRFDDLFVIGFGFSEEIFERETNKDDALAFVKLGLKLDPMKTWKKVCCDCEKYVEIINSML